MYNLRALRYMMPWLHARHRRDHEYFGGDPWPYGVEPNRPTLEALVQYLTDQSLIAAARPLEELFVPTTDGRAIQRRLPIKNTSARAIETMSNLDAVIKDLVIANRILAKEDVVDAYGHVSVRNPTIRSTSSSSRSLAPELIEKDDIVELGLDGQPVRDEKRSLYLERFIHAAIYEARPDVNAVVHAHAEDILPFGIARHAAAAGDPLRQLHRPERAGVGHRRQVRRHQPARHQHGPGPRPREVHGRQQRGADARPRLRLGRRAR